MGTGDLVAHLRPSRPRSRGAAAPRRTWGGRAPRHRHSSIALDGSKTLGVRVEGDLHRRRPAPRAARPSCASTSRQRLGQAISCPAGGRGFGLDGGKAVAVLATPGRSPPSPRACGHPDSGRRGSSRTLAAEQLVDGRAEGAPFQVPQRVVDAAERRVDHRAAGKARADVELVPDALDVHRVHADQPIGEIVDHVGGGHVGPGAVGFADAVQALIGVHLDKAKVAPSHFYQIGLDAGDLHAVAPLNPYLLRRCWLCVQSAEIRCWRRCQFRIETYAPCPAADPGLPACG